MKFLKALSFFCSISILEEYQRCLVEKALRLSMDIVCVCSKKESRNLIPGLKECWAVQSIQAKFE